jgi:hypothetical protein
MKAHLLLPANYHQLWHGDGHVNLEHTLLLGSTEHVRELRLRVDREALAGISLG